MQETMLLLAAGGEVAADIAFEFKFESEVEEGMVLAGDIVLGGGVGKGIPSEVVNQGVGRAFTSLEDPVSEAILELF
jgi:hypothetical protein